MGTDYYSYAIIGVEIDPEKLYTQKQQRACKCDIEFNEDAPPKHCMNCGKKFFETVKWPIDGWDEDDTLRGLKVVFGTDRERAFVSFEKFICQDKSYYDSESEKAFSQITPDELKELKSELKTVLGEDFWDEDKFGLHTVLFCSY